MAERVKPTHDRRSRLTGLLLQGNAFSIPLARASVHCVVTSPPYWGLRDYGLEPSIWGGDPNCAHVWGAELRTPWSSSIPGPNGLNKNGPASNRGRAKVTGPYCQRCGAWRGCLGLEPTPELYVAHLVMVFREVWRVLRVDGTVWMNLGDSYASDGGAKRAPREPKDPNEPSRWGDGSNALLGRPDRTGGLKPKDLCGIPWRVALALQADGWYLRSDIIWSKPNPMPESVSDRPAKSHEYLFLLAKSERYFYDAEAIKEPVTGGAHGRGNGVNPKSLAGGYDPHHAAPKLARLHVPSGWDTQKGGHVRRAGRYESRQCPSFAASVKDLVDMRNKRTVWIVATQAYPESHFATYPEALVEPCVLAGTSTVGCCPQCGAPWVRVVERARMLDGEPRQDLPAMRNTDIARPSGAQGVGHWRIKTTSSTTGWHPSCECDAGEPGPSTVLDPFIGSGTTGAVALRLGRRFVGLDLSLAYLELAKERTQLGPLADWREGRARTGDSSLDDLPMFATQSADCSE